MEEVMSLSKSAQGRPRLLSRESVCCRLTLVTYTQTFGSHTPGSLDLYVYPKRSGPLVRLVHVRTRIFFHIPAAHAIMCVHV